MTDATPSTRDRMADRRTRQASSGFALRLREVIEAHGSANSIATHIDRSEGAVRKWLRGESEPNVTDLRAVCELTGTSIEWLASGRGPRDTASVSAAGQERSPPPSAEAAGKPLNRTRLEAVLEALDAEIGRQGIQLNPAKRSLLIVTLYELCLESQKVDPQAVARLLRLAG